MIQGADPPFRRQRQELTRTATKSQLEAPVHCRHRNTHNTYPNDMSAAVILLSCTFKQVYVCFFQWPQLVADRWREHVHWSRNYGAVSRLNKRRTKENGQKRPGGTSLKMKGEEGGLPFPRHACDQNRYCTIMKSRACYNTERGQRNTWHNSRSEAVPHIPLISHGDPNVFQTQWRRQILHTTIVLATKR